MNYLISDMLIRIKNGYLNKKVTVIVCYSNFCLKILQLLYLNGFINGFTVVGNSIVIKLKYYQNDHIFKNLQLVSKPGRRCYLNMKELKKQFYYKNFVVVSNHYGLMTLKESIMKNCGGEVLFSLNYS
jgi:small subunit ribosomal protein S8